MKVKIIQRWSKFGTASDMEKDIEEFIRDKDVIDIKFTAGGMAGAITAYILYEDVYSKSRK